MEPIRVLIADDHTLFRQALRALLKSIPQVEVVGDENQASSAEEAIELTDALDPKIVLMDLRFNKNNQEALNGIEATRRILGKHPRVGVIVVTEAEDSLSLFAAIKAGARGYVPKVADQAELMQAIQAVMTGGMMFSMTIARQIQHLFESPEPAFPELNQREHEVLELIAQGRSNKEIAIDLSISEKRVRNVCSDIYSKIHVRDRIEAAFRARDAGLGHNKLGG